MKKKKKKKRMNISKEKYGIFSKMPVIPNRAPVIDLVPIARKARCTLAAAPRNKTFKSDTKKGDILCRN